MGKKKVESFKKHEGAVELASRRKHIAKLAGTVRSNSSSCFLLGNITNDIVKDVDRAGSLLEAGKNAEASKTLLLVETRVSEIRAKLPSTNKSAETLLEGIRKVRTLSGSKKAAPADATALKEWGKRLREEAQTVMNEAGRSCGP